MREGPHLRSSTKRGTKDEEDIQRRGIVGSAGHKVVIVCFELVPRGGGRAGKILGESLRAGATLDHEQDGEATPKVRLC